jgi:hypothetical protein
LRPPGLHLLSFIELKQKFQINSGGTTFSATEIFDDAVSSKLTILNVQFLFDKKPVLTTIGKVWLGKLK